MNVAVEHISTDQPPDETKARDLDYGWQSGNQIELLENGEAYFPRVFEAMRQARREILLETFILFEDKVGYALKDILIEAAQRGVKVVASLDGFGCGELSPTFLRELAEAGVMVRIFSLQDPGHSHQLVSPPAPQDRGGGRQRGVYRRDQFFCRSPGRFRPRGQAGLCRASNGAGGR